MGKIMERSAKTTRMDRCLKELSIKAPVQTSKNNSDSIAVV